LSKDTTFFEILHIIVAIFCRFHYICNLETPFEYDKETVAEPVEQSAPLPCGTGVGHCVFRHCGMG
jgi:hypothetical protein